MAEPPPSFFLVWNPQGRNPAFRHPDETAATNEAIRLAKSNPDQDYFVIEVLRRVRVHSPVEIEEFLTGDDRIPF